MFQVKAVAVVVFVGGTLLAGEAGSSSARSASCPQTAVSSIEYHGRAYSRVQLRLGRQGSLGTVSRWIQQPACNDVVGQPPQPAPPPVRLDFPLARLNGVAPQVAVAAADNPDSI